MEKFVLTSSKQNEDTSKSECFALCRYMNLSLGCFELVFFFGDCVFFCRALDSGEHYIYCVGTQHGKVWHLTFVGTQHGRVFRTSTMLELNMVEYCIYYVRTQHGRARHLLWWNPTWEGITSTMFELSMGGGSAVLAQTPNLHNLCS